MSKEAMKLALEALENSIDLVSNEAREAEKMYANVPTKLARVQGLVALEVAHEKAITALKAELAKDVPETNFGNMAEQPAQQEPVAWMTKDGEIYKHKCWPEYEARPLVFGDTSPPAQRTWVGLTDEVCNAFLQGIRYAANKYEAVSDERFTGGDVSNFLLMEAEELDSSDIVKALEAAHGIKENT